MSKTLTKRQTPWIAALILFGAACLFLPLGEIKIIASISSFGLLLVFIGVHGALITLRFRQPDLARGFKVPLSVGRFPVLPLLGILIALALLTRFEPIVYMVGGGAVGFGILIFFIHKRVNVDLDDDGRIIAVEGPHFIGFQFHPESMMSEYGNALLSYAICKIAPRQPKLNS